VTFAVHKSPIAKPPNDLECSGVPGGKLAVKALAQGKAPRKRLIGWHSYLLVPEVLKKDSVDSARMETALPETQS